MCVAIFVVVFVSKLEAMERFLFEKVFVFSNLDVTAFYIYIYYI